MQEKQGPRKKRMKAVHKLRVSWCKKEKTLLYHTPAGIHTKPDGHYMYGIINDAVVQELKERGYDPATLRFSIEPMKGNDRFDVNKEDNNDQPE